MHRLRAARKPQASGLFERQRVLEAFYFRTRSDQVEAPCRGRHARRPTWGSQVTKNFTRALCLGAVSYLVLSIDLSSPVLAQSATLPAVTVDAPVRQTARRAAPSRRRSANRAAARRTPSPLRQAEPVPYATPRTGIIGALPAAYAGGQVATGGQVGLLGNRSVIDTPFNQTSFTRELIENNQARTLPDVLISDPSVGSALPRNIGREQPVIRGFLLGNSSVAFNGYFGLVGNNNFNVLDAVERVEVIKGLNALLNGQSPDDFHRRRDQPDPEAGTQRADRRTDHVFCLAGPGRRASRRRPALWRIQGIRYPL